jgi:hypothetical protein
MKSEIKAPLGNDNYLHRFNWLARETISLISWRARDKIFSSWHFFLRSIGIPRNHNYFAYYFDVIFLIINF